MAITVETKQQGSLRWLWLTVLVIILDQVTKIIAVHFLPLGQPVYVLSVFNLTLAHNSGAAFSFLSQESGWQRWLFGIIAVLVCIAIIIWLKRTARSNHWLAAALALILGGAIGNLWDRIRLGYVIDFIQLHIHQWSWPIFNLADTAITIGAIMLAIDVIFRKDQS